VVNFKNYLKDISFDLMIKLKMKILHFMMSQLINRFTQLMETVNRYYRTSENSDTSEDKLLAKEQARVACIIDAIHNRPSFDVLDRTFQDFGEKLGLPVTGFTNGHAPSYWNSYEVARTTHNDLIRIQELHLYKSVLGPFYTIIGVDRSEITIEQKTIRSVNYHAISPVAVFEKAFKTLNALFAEAFRDHSYVLYHHYRCTVPGLSIPGYEEYSNPSIFKALFWPDFHPSAQYIGNVDYSGT